MLCSRILTKVTSVRNAVPIISQLHAINACNVQQQQFYSVLQQNIVAAPTRLSHPRIQELRCQYCSAGSTAGVVDSQEKQQNENILKRVLTKVGFKPNSKVRLKVASHMLYESVADKVKYLNFFREFNMPNTFNSWFLVTELHVWMLLVRAMAEGAESGEDGRFLRNCIVEAMWSDVNTRAKKLGAVNPSLTRRQIEILSEQFQAALIAYDEGVMSSDRILAAALWRRFFEMNCEDYVKIERMVKYVRQQMVMLDEMPREAFLNKPKIPWLDLEKIKVC